MNVLGGPLKESLNKENLKEGTSKEKKVCDKNLGRETYSINRQRKTKLITDDSESESIKVKSR